MKKSVVLLCLFMLFFQFNIQAQSPLNVKIDLVKNTITIDDVTFTNTSTIEDYEELLGSATRIVSKRGMDQYFAYDKLGIMLSLQKDSDVVGEIFFTYLNDGDGKVAKETYQGTVSVNNQVVHSKTTLKEMSKLTKANLVEVMNGYYITPKRPLNVLMFFPEGGGNKELKQLAFSFASAIN